MKTMTVGEFKARFSEVIEAVKKGEAVTVSYGKNHRPIGIFQPFEEKARKRKLGILSGKASFSLGKSFEITEEEFLG